MIDVAAAAFAGSIAVCLYVYGGYPILLFILARLRPRPVRRHPFEPHLSIIIPAYNEEESIQEKVRDTLANGYPREQLEIIVASDGSVDGTVAAVARMGEPEVLALSLPRRGKVRTLASAAGIASGGILVFSDADTLLAPGALRYLAENFADPDVGGVSGRKAMVRTEGGKALEQSEGLYVRFDEWQKEQETTFGSVVSSHGALHAVRARLFRPGSDPGAADDLAISARVVLQGKRLVYDRRAVALVTPPRWSRAELRRKVRIANQVLHALFALGPRLFTSGFYSLQLLSHKLFRYLVPIFLFSALASNQFLAMAAGPPWGWILLAQCSFYCLAALGTLANRTSLGSLRLLSVPYYFCLVNLAAFLAMFSVMSGSRALSWYPGGGAEPEVS